MKKTILSLALLLLTAAAVMAEDASQSVGISLGYANPVLRERNTATSTTLNQSTQMRGFLAGAVYEANIIKGFGVHLELNYGFGANVGKWAQINSSGGDYPRQKNTYTTLYFDMPVQWQYKFEIAKETYLLLYTGPALQVQFSFSQHNYLQRLPNATVEEKISNIVSKNYSADEDDVYDYRRTNVTWGVGAGFQFQRYYLRGGYDFGISNPYHDKVYNSAYTTESADYDWNRKGRHDIWYVKLGIYLWQHE